MIERIERTPSFKRDWKRLKAKHADPHRLEHAIQAIIDNDVDSLRRLRDHPLQGQWNGYRELHMLADWLFIYRIDQDTLTLTLTRTVSHDQLL